MVIGNNSYPSGSLLDAANNQPCGTGGFQVVAVDAVSLTRLSSGTFTTNGCGGDDQTGVVRMISYLYGLASNPPQSC